VLLQVAFYKLRVWF